MLSCKRSYFLSFRVFCSVFHQFFLWLQPIAFLIQLQFFLFWNKKPKTVFLFVFSAAKRMRNAQMHTQLSFHFPRSLSLSLSVTVSFWRYLWSLHLGCASCFGCVLVCWWWRTVLFFFCSLEFTSITVVYAYMGLGLCTIERRGLLPVSCLS